MLPVERWELCQGLVLGLPELQEDECVLFKLICGNLLQQQQETTVYITGPCLRAQVKMPSALPLDFQGPRRRLIF